MSIPKWTSPSETVRGRTRSGFSPKLFDVHTHTQFSAYESDADLVIKRSLENGIWLVNVGTQKDTSLKAVEFANKYPEGVYAAVGLHPIHTEKSYHDSQELGGGKEFESREEEFDYDFYKNLASDKKVVAIGECGLDYYRLSQDTKEKQKEAFLKQIELSSEIKKPLMVHCRNAFGDLIDILVNCQMLNVKCPGIIHFFSGSKDDAKRLIDLGFSFSFGGVITFARDYDEVIKYIPIDRILLETDAPYVAPIPHRGKRNEPVYIIEVAKKIAEIKGIEFDKVAETTTKNAFRIFNLKNKVAFLDAN